MGGTQGAVAHQVGVGGDRQAGGEGKQAEGKPGTEGEGEEGGEEGEVAGGVLGPEGVSRPCHRRRFPCPLQKSMEKPVGVQRTVTESYCLFLGLFLKSLFSCLVPFLLPTLPPGSQGLPLADPNPTSPGSVHWLWVTPG